jgi:hypothetical protein
MVSNNGPYPQVMDNNLAFIAPHVSTIDSNQTNETPTTIDRHLNTAVVSQSQLSRLTYNSLQPEVDGSQITTENNHISQNITSFTSTTQPPSCCHTPGVLLLSHQDIKNYVLEAYCTPLVPDSANVCQPVPTCKFTRECVISRSKVYVHGERLPSISPTVFKTKNVKNERFNYSQVDTQIVQCFNKLCKNSNTKLPKHFHFACYQHMQANQGNDDMKLIYYEGIGDTIVDQVVGVDNLREILNGLDLDKHNLIFPVCGKRCYNIVMNLRQKKKKKGKSEYSVMKNWEEDGNEINRSSIKVLLDWITTEENASNYFGGVDKKGKTNSNRKEAYHNHIRDLIKKENGKYLFHSIYMHV